MDCFVQGRWVKFASFQNHAAQLEGVQDRARESHFVGRPDRLDVHIRIKPKPRLQILIGLPRVGSDTYTRCQYESDGDAGCERRLPISAPQQKKSTECEWERFDADSQADTTGGCS